MKTDELLNMIISMMQSQKFADWYTTGRFDEFISGDMVNMSLDEQNNVIKTDLARMMRLQYPSEEIKRSH